MTEITYTVEGLRQIDDNLQALANQYGVRNALRALRKPVRDALTPVFNAIKNNTPVDTGDLRNSTFISISIPTKRQIAQSQSIPRDAIIQGSVGWRWTSARPLSHSALAIEFGNSRVSAQPVITPAFESNIPRINTTIANEIRASIESTARRLAKSLDKGRLVIK